MMRKSKGEGSDILTLPGGEVPTEVQWESQQESVRILEFLEEGLLYRCLD